MSNERKLNTFQEVGKSSQPVCALNATGPRQTHRYSAQPFGAGREGRPLHDPPLAKAPSHRHTEPRGKKKSMTRSKQSDDSH